MTRDRAAAGAGGGTQGGLTAVVATRRDEAGEALVREVQRARLSVRHLWPVPEILPEAVDLIFCDLLPDLPARLPWLPGEPKAALVVLLPSGGALPVDVLRNAAPEAFLQRPYTPQAVAASLVIARHRFDYERRLRSRVERLDATLRATRCVERAKTILMSTRRMAEEDAYGYMRTQAMERRVPVGTVAAAIVDAHDLLG